MSNTKDKNIIDVNESLYDAAEEGSLEKLNEAVANGADIHYLSPKSLPGCWVFGRGNSALHVSCYKGLRPIIDRLLELGADIHLKTTELGYTPLHLTSIQRHKEIVELLLDRGSNPNEKDKNGKTPLHEASIKGHKDIVELLLDRGSNPKEKDRNGEAPLHLASMQGHKEIAELLLDRGSNPNVKNNNRETPLHWASIQRNKEVVELLLSRSSNPNEKDEKRETPLHWASQNGHKEIAELLLVRGSNPNEKNKDGATPLRIASRGYYQELIATLRKWPATMAIIVLDDGLDVYYQLDAQSFIDLWHYIGKEEEDYIAKDKNSE